MRRRKVRARYLQEEAGEYTGSGAQTDRAFSPFSHFSCVTAVAAAVLAAAGIVPSVLTGGAVPERYAGVGLCGMPDYGWVLKESMTEKKNGRRQVLWAVLPMRLSLLCLQPSMESDYFCRKNIDAGRQMK